MLTEYDSCWIMSIIPYVVNFTEYFFFLLHCITLLFKTCNRKYLSADSNQWPSLMTTILLGPSMYLIAVFVFRCLFRSLLWILISSSVFDSSGTTNSTNNPNNSRSDILQKKKRRISKRQVLYRKQNNVHDFLIIMSEKGNIILLYSAFQPTWWKLGLLKHFWRPKKEDIKSRSKSEDANWVILIFKYSSNHQIIHKHYIQYYITYFTTVFPATLYNKVTFFFHFILVKREWKGVVPYTSPKWKNEQTSCGA